MKSLHIFYFIGGFTVLVLIGIFLFAVNEQKKNNGQIASYKVENVDRPKVFSSIVIADLGAMKMNEEKQAQFIIENKGTKPLQLFNVSSSCGCTVGKISINGTTSPEFGMHAKNNWTGTIEPGQSATLQVIYRPYVMPIKGKVTRDVFIQTNDPEKPKLTFTVEATVQ